jgi:hypothetical protein
MPPPRDPSPDNTDIPLAPFQPPVNPAAARTASQLVHGSPVGFDLSCVRCGYNLRGLPRVQSCPECNCPIADSLRDDRLDFADARWVRNLARGARLLQVSFLFHLLAAVSYVLLSIGRLIPACFFIIGLAVHAAGILLLTAREPRLGISAPRITRACRAASLLFIAAGLAKMIVRSYVPYFTLPALLAVALFLTGFHTLTLAKRIPNDSHAAKILNLAWFSAGMLLAGSLLSTAIMDLPGIMFFFCAAPAFLIYFLPLVAWSIVFHFLAKDFFSAAQASRPDRAGGGALPR